MRKALLVGIGVALAASLGAHRALRAGGESPTPARPAPPVYYVAEVSPGPAWLKGKPAREQPGIEQHFAWLGEQEKKGSLVMAGPFLDDTGGLGIYRAASLEAARTLIESDPSIRAGVVTAQVHPWLAAMSTLVEREAAPAAPAK